MIRTVEQLSNGALVLSRSGSVVLCQWQGHYAVWTLDCHGRPDMPHMGSHYLTLGEALAEFNRLRCH